MLGKTIFNFFFPALHPEEVDLPQVLLHLGRSRQAVPQPCALWHRMGPLLESTQRSGGASHSSPGTSWAFFPFRREKAEKTPNERERAHVQRGLVSWAARRITVLAPLPAGPFLSCCQVPAPLQPCVPSGTVLTQQSTAGMGHWDLLPLWAFVVPWVPLEEGRRTRFGLAVAMDGGDGCGSLLLIGV